MTATGTPPFQPATPTPWLRIEGVILILLGIAALVLPLAAGLAAALVFGWVLILSGVVGLISAFSGRGHLHLGWSIASAVIALIVGLLLLYNPVAGAVGLTILLAAYLFVDGVALIGLSLSHRSRSGGRWAWLLASGVIDVVLAVVMLLLTGLGSAVFIGFVVGIDLIAAGIALLAMHGRTTTAVPAI